MQTIHDERVDLRTWVGVLGTMLGAFMATLDIQVTNASLRDITGGIAATQDEGSWVSTSHLIGEIINDSECHLDERLKAGWNAKVTTIEQETMPINSQNDRPDQRKISTKKS